MGERLKDKLKGLRSQLSYLPRAIALVWTPAPSWTVAWGLLLIIQGLLPAVTVYLTRILVDSLVEAIALGAEPESIGIILWPAISMSSAIILSTLIQEGVGWIDTAQSEVVSDYIQARVHKKSIEADLGFYESPEYHNRLEQTQDTASQQPLELMEGLGDLVKNSITAVATIIILLPYGLWLPLVLVTSMIPSFFVVIHFNRRYHRWWNDTTLDRRWADYYSAMLTSEWVAPELRLFNLGNRFQYGYQQLRLKLRTEELRLLRDQACVRLIAKAAALMIGGATLGHILWQAILGMLTLGDLALFYQVFNQGQRLIRSLLGDIGGIYENSLYLENLFAFLDWQSTIVDPINPKPVPSLPFQGIRFNQITFRYPGSESPVFANFNLEVPAGKTIAIVGDNGAGKSTLLKLLCRFYDPESGSIEIDSVDIRDFGLRDLRDKITVLFQSPVEYRATAADNIMFGNIALGNSNDLSNRDAVEKSAIAAGAHDFITRLPQGYDTLLSKALAHGAELSGGEWQRVALARAFLRQAPIVILDEPTSAMDPWAEARWLERFGKMVRDRTTVIITHRFTAAMGADYIYLMQQGKIIEAGTHNQLLDQQGLYAEAWAKQTQTPPNTSSQF